MPSPGVGGGRELGSHLEGRGLPWPRTGARPRPDKEPGEAMTLRSGDSGRR